MKLSMRTVAREDVSCWSPTTEFGQIYEGGNARTGSIELIHDAAFVVGFRPRDITCTAVISHGGPRLMG